MTFARYTSTIQNGDVAIVYRGHSDVYPTQVLSGDYLNNKSGSFKHDDFIGKPWGSKFLSHSGKGYIFLLYPTPELWTQALPHRTQILYQADISIITSMLRIQPGSQIVESGTGSASFSHSLIRSLMPSGHLHTFEYHQDRSNAARSEFEEHGLAEYVTVQCRDVCKEGFGLSEVADAAFLDLPSPWEAVASAKQALRKDRVTRICCFSPCIEQVARTCATLRAEGFVRVNMVECLVREHAVRQTTIRHVDAGRSLNKRKLGPADATPLAASTLTCKPLQEARGHTSFLTFAELLPVSLSE